MAVAETEVTVVMRSGSLEEIVLSDAMIGRFYFFGNCVKSVLLVRKRKGELCEKG